VYKLYLAGFGISDYDQLYHYQELELTVGILTLSEANTPMNEYYSVPLLVESESLSMRYGDPLTSSRPSSFSSTNQLPPSLYPMALLISYNSSHPHQSLICHCGSTPSGNRWYQTRRLDWLSYGFLSLADRPVSSC
jgi:hypothetical protein